MIAELKDMVSERESLVKKLVVGNHSRASDSDLGRERLWKFGKNWKILPCKHVAGISV